MGDLSLAGGSSTDLGDDMQWKLAVAGELGRSLVAVDIAVAVPIVGKGRA